jgi:hypothetical protein
MASKSRYHKVCLGPGGSSDRITARNSHVGMQVVADYIDATDAQRYLLLERIGMVPATKRRSKKSQAAVSVPGPQAA